MKPIVLKDTASLISFYKKLTIKINQCLNYSYKDLNSDEVSFFIEGYKSIESFIESLKTDEEKGKSHVGEDTQEKLEQIEMSLKEAGLVYKTPAVMLGKLFLINFQLLLREEMALRNSNLQASQSRHEDNIDFLKKSIMGNPVSLLEHYKIFLSDLGSKAINEITRTDVDYFLCISKVISDPDFTIRVEGENVRSIFLTTIRQANPYVDFNLQNGIGVMTTNRFGELLEFIVIEKIRKREQRAQNNTITDSSRYRHQENIRSLDDYSSLRQKEISKTISEFKKSCVKERRLDIAIELGLRNLARAVAYEIRFDEVAVENYNKIKSRDVGKYLIMALKHNEEIFTTLLESYNACPNVVNVKGETALMIAARDGKKDAVLKLIEHGADISARNNEGNTAQMLAKNEEIIEILRKPKEKKQAINKPTIDEPTMKNKQIIDRLNILIAHEADSVTKQDLENVRDFCDTLNRPINLSEVMDEFEISGKFINANGAKAATRVLISDIKKFEKKSSNNK